MDLLLALTEDAVHEVLWTDELLAEWERVIVREQRRSAESAAKVSAAVRDFFAGSRVERDTYAHLIADMPGPDPNDRPHMAAAVAGGADSIVTWNAADFPAKALGELGLVAVDPDTYLVELLTELPDEVIATIVRLAGEKTRPPMSPSDLLDALARAGLKTFPEQARARLASS